MADFLDNPNQSNAPNYSVSELSSALKQTVESNFSHVRVRGEIGRVTRPASGHIYLDLKDEKSVINCNIWKFTVARLTTMPEEGMEVIATGKISTYAPQSKYNLIIETIEPAGEGALLALLEKRKKAFAAEGLFDESRKQALPFLPKRIGVVTSRSGAVIRDILHRLRERFPVEVILSPVMVQGKGSAEAVAQAVNAFNALPQNHPARPEVIIVARGGGSIEDLWGFNEEVVVRAVAASKIPVISAVGHETDTTLIDYVADRRAPTPTAAAEMAVPVQADLVNTVKGKSQRLVLAIKHAQNASKERLERAIHHLPNEENLLSTVRQNLDLLSMRLPNALERLGNIANMRFTSVGSRLSVQQLLNRVEAKKQQLRFSSTPLPKAVAVNFEQKKRALDLQIKLLDALSYERVLERGYAVIRDESGAILTSTKALKSADILEIQQSSGRYRVKNQEA